MNERPANSAIAEMPGTESLPRKSGELVFHADWERRAFALAVALCEQGHYDWDEFREQLMATIAASDALTEAANPTAPGYYEHWLASLEHTLTAKGLLEPEPKPRPTSAGPPRTTPNQRP